MGNVFCVFQVIVCFVDIFSSQKMEKDCTILKIVLVPGQLSTKD